MTLYSDFRKRQVIPQKNAGTLVEWSKGPGFYYANARTFDPLGRLPLVPELKKLDVRGEKQNRISLTINWTIYGKEDARWKNLIRKNHHLLRVFVHFLSADEDTILFQADHSLPELKNNAGRFDSSATTYFPDTAAGKQLRIVGGLYFSGSRRQTRLPLSGPAYRSNQIMLGTVKINKNGTVAFEKQPADSFDSRLNLQGKTVDFGFCKTDGAFRLEKKENHWALTPLPVNKSFHAVLPYKIFAEQPGFPENISACDNKNNELKDAVTVVRRKKELYLEIKP